MLVRRVGDHPRKQILNTYLEKSLGYVIRNSYTVKNNNPSVAASYQSRMGIRPVNA